MLCLRTRIFIVWTLSSSLESARSGIRHRVSGWPEFVGRYMRILGVCEQAKAGRALEFPWRELFAERIHRDLERPGAATQWLDREPAKASHREYMRAALAARQR
jgi:hypothetical protein